MPLPRLARWVALVAVALAGCSSSSPVATTASAGPPRAARVAPIAPRGTSCRAVVVNTLGAVARRIYGQAAHGRNVVAARRRLARSRVLGRAVAAGDPAATRAALAPLLRHQIRRIVVTRGPRTLAVVPGPPALAPVRGVVRDAAGRPVGSYVLSVADTAALASVTHALTGAAVRIGGGGATGGGAPRVTFGVHVFPAPARTEVVTVPAAAVAAVPCGATPRQTVAATVGQIGRRLFATEARGATVRRVLRHVAGDGRLRAAVAADDPVALRAAIIRFFRTRTLHVVRIRATTADGRLVGDVGGPDVLAPAATTVRDAAGRGLGTVTLSIQDDTGYIKLLRRFTGAAVELRTPAGTIAGSTLTPGPATVPAQGTVAYGGRRYDAVSFAARAFPSGPLTVAVLL